MHISTPRDHSVTKNLSFSEEKRKIAREGKEREEKRRGRGGKGTVERKGKQRGKQG